MAENGERRVYEKVAHLGLAAIGTLLVLLWGILWSTVTGHTEQITTVQADAKVLYVELKNIADQLTRIEKALERR